MYKTIIGLLTSPFMAFIYVYILSIPKHLKDKYSFSIKPFNCGFCMSFWLCLIYQLTQNNLIDSLFISSVSPFIYLYIEDKILDKWTF
jgi:hypothetical protein